MNSIQSYKPIKTMINVINMRTHVWVRFVTMDMRGSVHNDKLITTDRYICVNNTPKSQLYVLRDTFQSSSIHNVRCHDVEMISALIALLEGNNRWPVNYRHTKTSHTKTVMRSFMLFLPEGKKLSQQTFQLLII